MFYKIENTESEVFKKMKALREKELAIAKKNENLIKEKSGLTFSRYLGHPDQSGFARCERYLALRFNDPSKVDSKIWKKNKEYPECFEPNRRTKKGREMFDFLNSLETTYYTDVLKILNLKNEHSRFQIPYMEYINGVVLLHLDDNMIPEDKNVIEITSIEFDRLRGATE